MEHPMIIQVEQRSVYGSVKFYPLNQLAVQFAALMRQKTFDAANLKEIKALGVSVEIAAPVVTI